MRRKRPEAGAAGDSLASVRQHLTPVRRPADGPAGWAAPVASPFQLHDARQGEETRTVLDWQSPLRDPHGSDEQPPRELPSGGQRAPLTLAVRSRGLDDGDLMWSRTEAAADADTPRFVPKRPKREPPDAHRQQDFGYGQQASHADPRVGQALGSVDGRPWAPYLMQQEDSNRSPLTASPSQQSQGAVQRYTVSHSSEMSAPAAAAVAAEGSEQGGEWDFGPQEVGAWEADKQEVGLAPPTDESTALWRS
jgi:hypothetical protein